MASFHQYGKKVSTRAVIRVYWSQLKRYKWIMAVTLIAALTAVVVDSVILPLWYRQLINVLSGGEGGERAALYSSLIGILTVIISLRVAIWTAHRISGFLTQYTTPRVMRQLECQSVDYLLGHSYRFFTDSFAGSLVRRVTRLSRSFDVLYDVLIFEIGPLVVTVGGIIFVLVQRYPLIGLAVLAWVLIFAAVNFSVAMWKLKYDTARAEKDSEVTGVLSDIVTNAFNVKIFSGREAENGRFGAVTEELRKLRQLGWNIAEASFGMQWLLMIAIEAVVIIFALRLWSRGQLLVGDFVLFQAYLMSLFGQLRHFGRMVRNIYEHLADAKEMVEILNEPHEIRDVRGAKPLKIVQGRIDIKNVSFNYQKQRRTLEQFSLSIAPGEKIALVGPSGAGKSTVIKALFRFYDLDGGKILIDGQDISKVTQESLRNALSLVPQEPVLFHRTLMDNIRYGRREATDEDVIEASKKAHCHEFISSLPDGYGTFVGERGIKLLGGERQRVAIARAILRNAPILVLDEATSSLDSESEALIQDALRTLMQDKTVIVIAHRLSTIMQMDRIMVIEEGRVVDAGTHSQLLRKAGTYKKLWKIQVGSFGVS